MCMEIKSQFKFEVFSVMVVYGLKSHVKRRKTTKIGEKGV
jgi:hypothetical protein